MRKTTLIGQFLVIIFLTSCSVSQPEIITQVDTNQEVKNIILMIGDGMGLAQISAAAYSGVDRISFENFQVTGLHKSHSYSDLVTDSAAGATAFATGEKTFNGAIGVDKDTVAVKTILEECEEKGLATGLVATVAITHATPASFIAHQSSRVLYESIAADFLETEIDYFVGGESNILTAAEKITGTCTWNYSKKGMRYPIILISHWNRPSRMSGAPSLISRLIKTPYPLQPAETTWLLPPGKPFSFSTIVPKRASSS
jgi:alkaline phosphatase